MWSRGIGAGHLYLIGNTVALVSLADFYVAPQYRMRGLGKGLMKLGIMWANERGYNNIDGFMKNPDGLPEEYIAEWYRRQGFQVNELNISLLL
jgi:GNAT superfamily N-acetyltransferase